MIERIQLHPQASAVRCAYCHDRFQASSSRSVCSSCQATYHVDCVQEAGHSGCSNHGCTGRLRGAVVVRGARPLSSQARVAEVSGFRPLRVALGLFLVLLGLGCAVVAEEVGVLLSFFLIASVLFSSPRAPARARPRPKPAVAPRARKCLLCPQPAESRRYCDAHAALVGERITASPRQRGVNPGPRYGPGRVDQGAA